MKKLLAIIAATMLSAAAAQAHTHLTDSTPADRSVLTESPQNLMLHFSEATRLTALSVEKEGAGLKQDLGPLPAKPSAEVSVPLQALGPGKYTISWRAVGDDSHVMSGTLHFTVNDR